MFFLIRRSLWVKFQTTEDVIVMILIVEAHSNAAVTIHAISCCVIYKLLKLFPQKWSQ